MASAPVASVKLAFPLTLAALAAGVWYLWSNQGDVHTITLEQKAYGGMSFEPYAWWMTHRSGGYVHHYPDTVGPNCLNAALAAEDGAMSTSQLAAPYG